MINYKINFSWPRLNWYFCGNTKRNMIFQHDSERVLIQGILTGLEAIKEWKNGQSEQLSRWSVIITKKRKRENAKKTKKMTKFLKEKVYVFLRIADRQTDKIMYRIDRHMSKNISSKSHFPLNFTDGRTFERTNKVNYRVASLLSR